MALPGTISTRPIFGTFFGTDGNFLANATLTCNQFPARVDDTAGGAIVYRKPYVISTDASGYASGSFIASDDADLDIRDWTYEISVSASGIETDVFHIRVVESLPASGEYFTLAMTDPASGEAGSGAPIHLNDLVDVNTAGAASGYALLYNGTTWIAGAVTASGSFATQAYVDSAVSGLVSTSDSRLADSRTPTAHHTSHASGGSDAITPAAIGAATAAQGAKADAALDQTAGDARYLQDADGSKGLVLASADLVIVRNETAGTYALRSTATASATRNVIWRGSVAPTIGGGYAINNVDIWEKLPL